MATSRRATRAPSSPTSRRCACNSCSFLRLQAVLVLRCVCVSLPFFVAALTVAAAAAVPRRVQVLLLQHRGRPALDGAARAFASRSTAVVAFPTKDTAFRLAVAPGRPERPGHTPGQVRRRLPLALPDGPPPPRPPAMEHIVSVAAQHKRSTIWRRPIPPHVNMPA